jgi:hypothetical protein
MIVTPAQAGVQFKDVWIPACAGVTNRQLASGLLNNILDNIFERQQTHRAHLINSNMPKKRPRRFRQGLLK